MPEQSPNLTNINRLPDEVLLDIFDSYRQSITDQYDNYWRKKYAWFNLAHVCRRWRAVTFTSSSRLDLNVIVRPVKPGAIKTIPSGHLPILIDYTELPVRAISINETSVWRLRASLTHHRDRVREISFGGSGSECYPIFTKFIQAASHHFPALESLVFCFEHVRKPLEFPATFLRGPDQSDLPFRRLGWYGSYSTFSISGFLPSATALTDLTLNFATSNLGQFDPSERSSFFARLQGMQRLRKLDLTMPSVGFCPRPSIRRFPKILPPVF